ncbi:MAG TPA: hypothetical protein VLC46_06670 [Thermoanaerobaculia bacterium]|jgi:hypothetical protein|nr:hypothetical protein [Thermoanaerobaculia bacterium]
MAMNKMSDAEYVKLSPGARVRAWRWWFVVLLLLAAAAAALAMIVEFRTAGKIGGLSITPSPVLAFASSVVTGATLSPPVPKDSDLATKTYVMIGILSLIAIVTLVCLGVSLFSKDEHAVSTASDMLKTCIGFFIGIATSYFGATH